MTKEEQLKQEAKKSCIDKTHYCKVILTVQNQEKSTLPNLKRNCVIKKCNNKDCPVFIKLVQANKENAKLKNQLFTLRNERNTFLAQNEQYEKDLIDFNENLIKAKEIIKKLKALYLYPVVTKDDVKRQDEILAKAEQFLKEVSE